MFLRRRNKLLSWAEQKTYVDVAFPNFVNTLKFDKKWKAVSFLKTPQNLGHSDSGEAVVVANGMHHASFWFSFINSRSPSPQSHYWIHEKFARFCLQTRPSSPKRALSSTRRNPSPGSPAPLCFGLQNPRTPPLFRRNHSFSTKYVCACLLY